MSRQKDVGRNSSADSQRSVSFMLIQTGDKYVHFYEIEDGMCKETYRAVFFRIGWLQN